MIFRSLAFLALALAIACGGGDDDNGQTNSDAAPNPDSSGAIDAPMADATPITDCVEDLGTVADGSMTMQQDPNLVISEIDPGEFIEVYNAGSGAVLLSATNYIWCNNQSYPSFGSHDVEVAPGGRRTLAWPGGGGVDAGGDVSIYVRSGFSVGANILDYVCWGDPANGGRTRKMEADMVSKWVGACAPAIPAGGTLVRLPNQDGVDADDYATQDTPSPENCE